MPFNGSGTFTRTQNWSNDATNNLPISASKFDNQDNDFASGFNNCLTRDGQGAPTSNLTWAVVLSLTKAGDGSGFSVGRTGGSNNPNFQVVLTDASSLVQLNNTLAGGTIALAINGVSVASATASAFTVAQPATFSSSASFSTVALAADGTAGAPSIAFTNATNAGLYKFGAGALGFAAGGSAAGSISSAQAWSLPAATAAITFSVTGAANQYGAKVTSSSTSGQGFGVSILGGTNASDQALTVANQANTATFLQLFGDGHGNVGPNTTNKFSWDTSGAFSFAGSSTVGAVTLTVNSLATTAGTYALQVNGSTTSGTRGMVLKGGTASTTDNSFSVQDSGGTVALFNVSNAASNGSLIQGRGAVGSGLFDMTPDAGSFTITYNLGTATVTGTAVYSKMGNHMLLFLPAATTSSNGTGFTMTGLPSAFQPTRTQTTQIPDNCAQNNGAKVAGATARFTAASSTITCALTGNDAGWTSAVANGIATACVVEYLLN